MLPTDVLRRIVHFLDEPSILAYSLSCKDIYAKITTRGYCGPNFVHLALKNGHLNLAKWAYGLGAPMSKKLIKCLQLAATTVTAEQFEDIVAFLWRSGHLMTVNIASYVAIAILADNSSFYNVYLSKNSNLCNTYPISDAIKRSGKLVNFDDSLNEFNYDEYMYDVNYNESKYMYDFNYKLESQYKKGPYSDFTNKNHPDEHIMGLIKRGNIEAAKNLIRRGDYPMLWFQYGFFDEFVQTKYVIDNGITHLFTHIGNPKLLQWLYDSVREDQNPHYFKSAPEITREILTTVDCGASFDDYLNGFLLNEECVKIMVSETPDYQDEICEIIIDDLLFPSIKYMATICSLPPIDALIVCKMKNVNDAKFLCDNCVLTLHNDEPKYKVPNGHLVYPISHYFVDQKFPKYDDTMMEIVEYILSSQNKQSVAHSYILMSCFFNLRFDLINKLTENWSGHPPILILSDFLLEIKKKNNHNRRHLSSAIEFLLRYQLPLKHKWRLNAWLAELRN